MPGNEERLVDDDGLGAGARLAGDVPVVLDPPVRAGRQQEAGGRRRALVFGRELHAQQGPLRVVHVGGEQPLALHEVAAIDLLRHRGRRIRAAHDGRRVVAPHVVLRLLGEGADQPLVDGPQRAAPGRRGAAARQFAHHIDECGEAVFVAAMACGLHELEEARVVEGAGRFVGNAAVPLRLLGPRAQHGHQIACGCNDRSQGRGTRHGGVAAGGGKVHVVERGEGMGGGGLHGVSGWNGWVVFREAIGELFICICK